MIATEVITDVSAYLNDNAQTRFPPSSIIPYLSIANTELAIALANHGISVVRQNSVVTTLAKGTYLVPLPVDMLTPTGLYERQGGATSDQFVEMTKCSPLPEVPATNTFNVWDFFNNQVVVGPANNLGALSYRDVKMIYNRLILSVTGTGSTIDVPISKTFLGKRTASLIAANVGENQTRAETLDIEARGTDAENKEGGALGNCLNIFIREQQDAGVRRRSYHRPRFWRG